MLQISIPPACVLQQFNLTITFDNSVQIQLGTIAVHMGIQPIIVAIWDYANSGTCQQWN